MTRDIPLTEEQVATLREAFMVFSGFVPQDHRWTREERRLWEAAHRLLKRIEAEFPADRRA